MTYSQRVAKALLDIHAVTLSPDQPFTWASGLKSPIYTDNRLTISYPEVRQAIFNGMVEQIKLHFSEADVIAGTATAGIPHAAWVAQNMELPMIYVRTKPKDHGQGKQIEGVLKEGQKVVVIDDLISTGGSVLNAVRARFRSYQAELKSHGMKRARARRDAGRTRQDIVTLVKRQLTREIAEGRFRGSLEAVKREIDRRVKERMIMSRNNNYTRLATASP